VSSEESRHQYNAAHDERLAQVADMLPAYVLGILDDDELLTVEAALASSERLRHEFRQLQSAVDLVNDAVPLVAPPDKLRARVLESAAHSDARDEPIPITRNTRFRAVSAVAAILVVMVGGVIAALVGEVRERDDEISTLQASMARPGTDFTQPLVWSTIDQPAAGAPIRGYFCRTEDGSVGWIIVEGMRMEDNHVFQLWLVEGERVVNGGMFATDEEGRGFGVVRVGVPVHTFSQLWITIEPPGGSPLPTKDPDLKAPIV
jgi:anti-sigma-K factor RskA